MTQATRGVTNSAVTEQTVASVSVGHLHVMRNRRIVISAFLFVALVDGLGWVWNRAPERRWGYFRNEEAFCHNCSSFLSRAMEFYADDHDGWYPRGRATPLDALGTLVEDYDVRIWQMTCHAFAGDLQRHFEEHHQISPKFCCYRYNEGLREEDPDDLVVLYYFKPTVWESHSRKGQQLGRQILTTSGWGWEFISESAFQELQRKTDSFLQERIRRAHETDMLTSNLILTVTCTNLAVNSYRFSAKIENDGTSDAAMLLLEPGHLIHREDYSGGAFFLEEAEAQIILAPGETHFFPGWYELTVEDQMMEGMLVSRSTQTRSFSGLREGNGTPIFNSGQGRSEFGQGTDVLMVNSRCRVQASLRANVSVGNVRDLIVVLKSKEFKYMEPHNEKNGAANGSLPIRSEANSTSPKAGSRR